MILEQANKSEQIDALIDSWIYSYKNRDLAKFRSLLSTSETHVSWGTGGDERYVGISNYIERVQRDFAQSEAADLVLLNSYKVIHDKFSWAAVEIEPIITIAGEAHKLPVLRGTFVFAHENGKWVIEHCHGSWPYPEQKEGDSFSS